MSKFDFKNYIFDLDGTLINSLNEVFRCFEVAFKKTNYPLNKSNLTQNVIGPPLKDIVRLIAPELEDDNILDEIVSNFRETYDSKEEDSSFLYEGVSDILKELKENGCRVFMATYKPMLPSLRIVEKYNIDYFDEIYGIDKYGKHITKEYMLNDILSKYELNKSETVMVGDAHTDVLAARAVGVYAIGALWGYGEDKTLLKQNSDYLMNDISELKTFSLERV